MFVWEWDLSVHLMFSKKDETSTKYRIQFQTAPRMLFLLPERTLFWFKDIKWHNLDMTIRHHTALEQCLYYGISL